MGQIDRESISALLDNEADDLELRRFLKASEQDPSLVQAWERYNLAQSVLHGSGKAVNSSLSQRIAAQIANEAPLAMRTSWQQSLTKMAVAASVAAVFLVTVQVSLDSNRASSLPEVADQSAAPSTDASEALAAAVPIMLAEANGEERIAVVGGVVRQYIESLTLDDEEPVRVEHIQDSPLYRLVNELQAKP
jgi:negative regulator of sigma E activity